jgi:5-(carboxyamino)imidazole ribonucleotide synthase
MVDKLNPVNNKFPKVGVIGAGQLARMMAVGANDLGLNFEVMAQNDSESAAQTSPFAIGDHQSISDIRKFAAGKDVVTFEHELTSASALMTLEKEGVKFYPHPTSFAYSQNKIQMRQLMRELKLYSPTWQVWEQDAGQISLTFPLIAKLPSGGYDGRGVWKIDSQAELNKLQSEVKSQLLLEELINFDYEAAVMVARSPHNQVATWAPTKTVQQDGICTMTITPVPEMSEELASNLQSAAIDIAKAIDLVGVMAVEVFIKGNAFYINELALRPHNSGHWTIEGAKTSQFEQHLRAVLDLPLGSTELTNKYVVMGNILGGEKTDLYRPYLHLMARTPSLKFHQYGKEVRVGRKVGHVTLTGDDLAFLISEVSHAVDYFSGEVNE